jgi:hypothetical protein
MLHVCVNDLCGSGNRMILLLEYTILHRGSELVSLRVEDLTQCNDRHCLILLRQSKTDQACEGILLPLDIETTSAVKKWFKLASIEHGLLLRGITGRQLNKGMDPGQISRVFRSIAVTNGLDPRQISGHSTRVGAVQDLVAEGANIGQIIAKVSWTKVDTVMRYAGINNLEALGNTSAKMHTS